MATFFPWQMLLSRDGKTWKWSARNKRQGFLETWDEDDVLGVVHLLSTGAVLQGQKETAGLRRVWSEYWGRWWTWRWAEQVIDRQNQNLQFKIVCLHVQRRVSSWGGWGSFELVEVKESTISKTVEAGMEIPLHCGHKHWIREIIQLVGLPAQQKAAKLVRRRRVPAAFPQRQHQAVILWRCSCICK